jgi:hypothetical protein
VDHRQAFAPHVTSVVLGMLAAILLINGIVQASGGAGGAPRTSLATGGVMFVVGVALVYALIALRRSAARKSAADNPAPRFILSGGRLLDGDRRDLAALSDVRTCKVLQATSSSRALVLQWPGGKSVVARGIPFGDSVHDCEHILRVYSVAKRSGRGDTNDTGLLPEETEVGALGK